MAEIKFDKRNYRKHGERNKNLIEKSLKECGAGRSIVVDADGEIIAGNGIYEAAQKAKIPVREIETDGSELVVVRRTDLHTEDDKRKQLAIMDNSTSDSSEFDLELLREDFEIPQLKDFGIEIRGYNEGKAGALSEKFIIPPFSVLNAAAGDWQARKKEWLNLGIKSEVGRSTFYDGMGKLACFDNDTASWANTSIFDPVLCEIAYTWFSKQGDHVLDPFAGGSVRGITASVLNRAYTGIDLRSEQVEANRANAEEVLTGAVPEWITGDSNKILDDIEDETFDFVLSCPPYADLEVYSDNPDDLSNMEYKDFISVYRLIIAKTYRKLKNNRFAVWVVGEVRDKNGNYYNFLGDTISAFMDAGFRYYNELILRTCCVTAGLRAGKQFEASRKAVKTHQNVLVFEKGDAKQAAERIRSELCRNFAINENQVTKAHESVLVFVKGDGKETTDRLGFCEVLDIAPKGVDIED